jgi:hypothetical protein
MFSARLYILCGFLGAIVNARPSTCPHQSSSFQSKDICSYPSEPYTVKCSHGKGLGVFARHTLEAGDIIMRERPVLKISRPEYTKGTGYPMAKVTELVRAEYALLSPGEQEEVIGLTHHVLPEEEEPQGSDVLGFIFRTNAYNTDTGFGLFPKIARINHSCRPNAAYYWSQKLNQRIIYASRTIKEGEEISDSYIPLLLSREERQKKLDRYGFNCTCSACAQSSKVLSLSDKRRTEISSGLKAFTDPPLTLSNIPHDPVLLRKARRNANLSLRLAELVEQEGIADYYAIVYRLVAISHANIGDWEKATVWANKGYERRRIEDATSGYTNEMYALTSQFIERWEEEIKGRLQ